jgi:hypothetical protein
MKQYPLIGVSICAVVLLVLGSLTNVVGYQSVKSTALSDSPLFSERTKRAINEENDNVLTSNYLGKGQYSIPFPVRDNRTELIRKFIDQIKAMDDDTFDRFVNNVVNQINHRDTLKGIDAKEIVKELRQVRESTQNIIVDENANDSDEPYSFRFNFVPTICWFPGCLVLTVPLFMIYAIFVIIIILLLGLATLATCSYICWGPPTKQCIMK